MEQIEIAIREKNLKGKDLRDIVLDGEKRDAFDRSGKGMKLSLKKQNRSDSYDPFERQGSIDGKHKNHKKELRKNYPQAINKKVTTADDVEDYNPFAKIQKTDEIVPNSNRKIKPPPEITNRNKLT